MIEIICDSDNDNKSKDSSKKNTVIRTPKNIKQIGDISSDKKIFIEDYAFSYINSLAYGLDGQEQSGVLLGEYHKTSSEKCLFIKGVVKKKSTQTHDDRPGFNENVWSSIYSDIEKYFPNLEVVGWFAAIPGITPEWMEYLKKLHKDNFTGGLKTLYIVDIREKTENFYLYENGRLKKQSGYVCYYERNYEMQEYMLQKRGRHSVESSEKDKVIDPVVGWLVCIKGDAFGSSFVLKSGKNFIGRDRKMDVALTGDKSVSRECHAIVIYDPRSRMFLVQPGTSRELFYLNDKVVLGVEAIGSHDILAIGKTELMFIPCCGESFCWEDQIERANAETAKEKK